MEKSIKEQLLKDYIDGNQIIDIEDAKDTITLIKSHLNRIINEKDKEDVIDIDTLLFVTKEILHLVSFANSQQR